MPNDVIYDIGLRIDPKKAKSGSKEVEGALNRINDRAKRLRNTVGTIFAGFSAVAAVRSLVTIGDEMTLLRARLGLVTDGYQDMISTQRELLDLSIQTNSDLSTTTDLYIKLSRALQESGESSESILGVTKTINEAFRVSGASTIERTNAIRQLNQAMASGVLRGDEFRAVSEQGIRVTQLLADSLNVTIGELREMANAGELTTDVLIRAFKDQSQVVAEESAKIPRTVGEAFTNLSSVYKTYIGNTDKASGFTKAFASTINSLSESLPLLLDRFATLVKLLLAMTAGKLLSGLIKSFVTFGLTARVTSGQVAGFTLQLANSNRVALTASKTFGILKTVMGGWVGVGITAVASLIAFSDATDKVNVSTKKLIESNNRLIASKRDLYPEDERVEITKTFQKIAELVKEKDKLSRDPARFQFIGAGEINQRIREITGELKTLTEQKDDLIKRVKIATGEFYTEAGAVNDAKKSFSEYVTQGSKSIELFIAQSSAIKTGKDSLISFWNVLKNNQKTVTDWIANTKKEIQSLKERNILLKDGEKALLSYQAKRLKLLTDDEKQKKLIDELIKQKSDEIDKNNELIESERDRIESVDELNQKIKESIDVGVKESDLLLEINQRNIDFKTTLENLRKEETLSTFEREKAILKRELEAKSIHLTNKELEEYLRLTKGIVKINKSTNIFVKMFDEIKTGLKNTLTSVFQGIGGNISGLFSGTTTGFVNGLQGFSDGLSNIASVFEQSGGNILRSANTLLGGAASSVLAANAAGVGGLSGLASIAGPVAIAAIVAGLIDNISGGKLFGTSFEQVGSGFTGGITGAGSVGSQSITEQKERSFFRGTATRVTTSELDQELRRIFDEIFDTSILVAEQTARTLGIDIATLVTGSITQAFDENGELTSSISTVLGRTYEEGIEEFAQRLTAENILAQLAQNATSVSVTRTTSASTINNPLFDSEFSDIGEIVSTTTSMVNEVHAIAEQWRNDSALLLEGAQFLLLAQTDLNNGFDLLNDGTLTQITDLIQGFNRAGETLSETYSRVVLSTNNFENALDLMGISIDKKRQQFIQFAVDITDAAGGLDQASSLWNSYIKDFFSSNEVLTNSLDALNQDINAQLSELGVKVDFDSFRQRFEEALPTLSPQEVVQWLRLGQALGDANNLAGELAKGGIVEAITNYAGLSQEVANASQTLDQSLISNFNSINDLINAYDGSIESERSIAAGLNARYNMELQFIEQIRTASESVRQTIASSIDSIRASQMTDEERYDFLTSQAEALASSLSNLTDPEEIERVINEITRLQNEAFGLLDESGQAQRADDFILFLEEVGKISQGRLRQLETDISKDSDNLVKQMEELLIASQEREDEAIRRFDNSVSRITKATDIFDSATQRFAGSNIQVDVNNPVYDVDNL